jgi:hypothetical protein
MGIRPELWFDDSVKGIELPTSCITLSKYQESCGFLKNMKVPSSYSTNMYYDQLQEIWELDFHDFKIPLFCCNWVDAIKGVV